MRYPKFLSPRRSPADEPCSRAVCDCPGDFFAVAAKWRTGIPWRQYFAVHRP